MQDLPSNTFIGKPCRKCGSDLRYFTSKPGGRCVDCVRRYERERAGSYRQAAKSIGQITFEGKPCKKCTGTVRYAVTHKCVTCQKNHSAKSRKKNRDDYLERYRGKYRDKLYTKSAMRQKLGICDKTMDAILLSQEGACAICKNSETGGRALSVDHCHKTGVFRGLLCHKCNTGIGFFNDDPEILRAAIEYLENNRWII